MTLPTRQCYYRVQDTYFNVQEPDIGVECFNCCYGVIYFGGVYLSLCFNVKVIGINKVKFL